MIPCGHTRVSANCHFCHLASVYPSYRRHWGMPTSAPEANRTQPCQHLGDKVGYREQMHG